MTIDKTIVCFSDCDDNYPQGKFITTGESPKELFAYVNDNYTCGSFFVAFNDIISVEDFTEDVYYLFSLEGED